MRLSASWDCCDCGFCASVSGETESEGSCAASGWEHYKSAGCWFTATVNFVLDPSPMLFLPAETPVSDWRGEFQPLPPGPLSGGDRNLLPDGMVLGEPRTDTAETLHHCQAPGAVQEVSECVFDLLSSKSQVLIPASTSKLIHLWLTK